jgi:endonuclease/exonuclease/phosphatase family metal-dependent hydrolase
MSPALRLASFNILEGLQPIAQDPRDRRHMDRERADAALTVVAELRPDILVLNEALFCREHDGRRVEYARLFGFPYEAAALYDQAWGNAILSRWPIAESVEMQAPDHARGGLVAIVEAPAGRLAVGTYHPHPNREPADKAADFVRLVAGVAGPLIVAGDFNCISPEDPFDRPAMIAAFRRFSADAEATVDRFIASGVRVFEVLGGFGLRDAVPPAGRRYSMPTDLIALDKSSAIRIDHVLANDGIEVVGGEVVHSAASNRASDHHPVLLEFRIR